MLNRFVLAALAALALAAPAGAAELVVHVDRVHGGDGRPLAAKWLLIGQGHIERIVTDDVIPVIEPARQIDARALVVVPGFVDTRSGAGLSVRNEEGSEVTPSLRAVDLLDAGSVDFQRALESGVTTVIASPGGRSVIGGLASAMKTSEGSLRARSVDPDAGLVITLGTEPSWSNRLSRFSTPTGLYYRRPGTRMGVVSEVRRAFADAKAGASGEGADVLRRALAGELPVLWRAQVQQDILTAMRLAGELGIPRSILVNPVEGHRIPETVARANGAVLGPFYEMPRRLLEGVEGQDFRDATPKILADAGVPVAIATGPDDNPGALRDRAMLAMRAGLSPEAALASITGTPARMFGLDRAGDIAVGKDADLVFLDGPPLAPTTRVVAVMIDGEIEWHDPSVELFK